MTSSTKCVFFGPFEKKTALSNISRLILFNNLFELNWIRRTRQEATYSAFSNTFVFCRSLCYLMWLPLSLISWHLFIFSTASSEQNMITLDGMEVLKISSIFIPRYFYLAVLHILKLKMFRADLPSWPLICWDVFNFPSATTGENSTKHEESKHFLISMIFFCSFYASLVACVTCDKKIVGSCPAICKLWAGAPLMVKISRSRRLLVSGVMPG